MNRENPVMALVREHIAKTGVLFSFMHNNHSVVRVGKFPEKDKAIIRVGIIYAKGGSKGGTEFSRDLKC